LLLKQEIKMAESGYAFIKAGNVVNIAVFDDPSDELLAIFKAEFSLDDIVPMTDKAAIGSTWDGTKFWLPKPFPSWVKNEETNEWEAPVAKPTDDKFYGWFEQGGFWVEIPPKE
jgi:hypothetical protein